MPGHDMLAATVVISLTVISLLSWMATSYCIVGGFDLSTVPQAELVIQQQYGTNPLTPYTWVINFCQPVNSPPNGATPCTDKATGNALTGYITEYSTTHCETTWNAMQSGQGADNQLVVNLAQIAPSNHVGWTATATLNCAPSSNPALVPTDNVVVTGATNALNFAFTFTTSAVCGSPSAGTPTPQTPMPPGPPGPTPSPNTPIPGPTPPTPPPQPGPAPEEEPACSGGCAFVIIVFVGGFLYVVATVAFYYFRQEKRGRDLLPHPEFWKEFASLVRDGVVFSVQKIRALICKSGPYAGDGYQQV